MSENLPISEKEHATLIRESVGGKFTSAVFGPGHVSLRPVPSNDWAMLRVAEMRGITIDPSLKARIEASEAAPNP